MELKPGKTFTIGGKDYIIPRQSVRGIRETQNRYKELAISAATEIAEFNKLQGELEEAMKTPENLLKNEDALAKLKEFQQKSSHIVEMNEEMQWYAAYTAFKRNYPDVEFDDFLDLGEAEELKEVLDYVLGGDENPKKD